MLFSSNFYLEALIIFLFSLLSILWPEKKGIRIFNRMPVGKKDQNAISEFVAGVYRNEVTVPERRAAYRTFLKMRRLHRQDTQENPNEVIEGILKQAREDYKKTHNLLDINEHRIYRVKAEGRHPLVYRMDSDPKLIHEFHHPHSAPEEKFTCESVKCVMKGAEIEKDTVISVICGDGCQTFLHLDCFDRQKEVSGNLCLTSKNCIAVWVSYQMYTYEDREFFEYCEIDGEVEYELIKPSEESQETAKKAKKRRQREARNRKRRMERESAMTLEKRESSDEEEEPLGVSRSKENLDLTHKNSMQNTDFSTEDKSINTEKIEKKTTSTSPIMTANAETDTEIITFVCKSTNTTVVKRLNKFSWTPGCLGKKDKWTEVITIEKYHKESETFVIKTVENATETILVRKVDAETETRRFPSIVVETQIDYGGTERIIAELKADYSNEIIHRIEQDMVFHKFKEIKARLKLLKMSARQGLRQNRLEAHRCGFIIKALTTLVNDARRHGIGSYSTVYSLREHLSQYAHYKDMLDRRILEIKDKHQDTRRRTLYSAYEESPTPTRVWGAFSHIERDPAPILDPSLAERVFIEFFFGESESIYDPQICRVRQIIHDANESYPLVSIEGIYLCLHRIRIRNGGNFKDMNLPEELKDSIFQYSQGIAETI